MDIDKIRAHLAQIYGPEPEPEAVPLAPKRERGFVVRKNKPCPANPLKPQRHSGTAAESDAPYITAQNELENLLTYARPRYRISHRWKGTLPLKPRAEYLAQEGLSEDYLRRDDQLSVEEWNEMGRKLYRRER